MKNHQISDRTSTRILKQVFMQSQGITKLTLRGTGKKLTGQHQRPLNVDYGESYDIRGSEMNYALNASGTVIF